MKNKTTESELIVTLWFVLALLSIASNNRYMLLGCLINIYIWLDMFINDMTIMELEEQEMLINRLMEV